MEQPPSAAVVRIHYHRGHEGQQWPKVPATVGIKRPSDAKLFLRLSRAKVRTGGACLNDLFKRAAPIGRRCFNVASSRYPAARLHDKVSGFGRDVARRPKWPL